MDVFTSLKALQTPYYRDFMEASSWKHDQSLIPFAASLLEDAGVRWKISSFYSRLGLCPLP